MSGTRSGAAKAMETIRKRHGKDFHKTIGRIGGMSSNSGGFASTVRGSDGRTGLERARIAGAIGGKISRKSKGEK